MQTHEAAQHTSATVQPPAVCVALCVDDYGLHEGVNRAVGELAALGRVQATSAMVGGAAWASGLALLRQLDPAQVQVGLHLDLTECALNPALRLPLGRCIAQAYLRRFDTAALAREIAQQLDRFEQGLGRPPAYVDGHQHIHQLPQVRELLLAELARRYSSAQRRTMWLRSTRAAPRAAQGDARTAFKSAVIASLGRRALLRQARVLGLQHNAHLLGVYDFTGGADGYRARLARWLHAARQGDLLMCHVGLPTTLPDVLAGARQDEFAVIGGPAFGALLEQAQVRLQPMGSSWFDSCRRLPGKR